MKTSLSHQVTIKDLVEI